MNAFPMRCANSHLVFGLGPKKTIQKQKQQQILSGLCHHRFSSNHSLTPPSYKTKRYGSTTMMTLPLSSGLIRERLPSLIDPYLVSSPRAMTTMKVDIATSTMMMNLERQRQQQPPPLPIVTETCENSLEVCHQEKINNEPCPSPSISVTDETPTVDEIANRSSPILDNVVDLLVDSEMDTEKEEEQPPPPPPPSPQQQQPQQQEENKRANDCSSEDNSIDSSSTTEEVSIFDSVLVSPQSPLMGLDTNMDTKEKEEEAAAAEEQPRQSNSPLVDDSDLHTPLQETVEATDETPATTEDASVVQMTDVQHEGQSLDHEDFSFSEEYTMSVMRLSTKECEMFSKYSTKMLSGKLSTTSDDHKNPSKDKGVNIFDELLQLCNV